VIAIDDWRLKEHLFNHKSKIRNQQLPGAVAQLGERLVCNQKVVGSIPISSTDAVRLRFEFRISDLGFGPVFFDNWEVKQSSND
jgi:hypothetical protein